MNQKRTVLPLLTLFGVVAGLTSGCIIAERDHGSREEGYREGYYDRDQRRYYHEHQWHDCGDRDDHCR